MPNLRETDKFKEMEALRVAFRDLDHWPEIDPDELIPRYWESRLTLDGLGYVEEWDLPDDVREALDVVMAWLGEEHEAHARLLDQGRLETAERNQ